MPRTLLLGLAMIALVMLGSTARAQLNINPFSAYVRQLVGGGSGNPNQLDDSSRTAMHYAASNGNLQIIAILIKADAKLNPVDPLGDTPLHLAVEQNQIEAAKLLLDAGADVDPQNKDGMTPLMIAASHGNLEMVRALLAKGANPAKTDYTGRDAVSWAQDGHRPAVIDTLTRAAGAKGS
jgi:uncharacterized protein